MLQACLRVGSLAVKAWMIPSCGRYAVFEALRSFNSVIAKVPEISSTSSAAGIAIGGIYRDGMCLHGLFGALPRMRVQLTVISFFAMYLL
ncbi:hypothetical protein BPAE_0056g00350 [Botrytis paeoniae]|uniref:Uncharacterized protein n=1 Tax=Botrytis paeoniae TaxID=278948 RepID=A0A4Z1FP33_9HELO|nr:hypothetical protein BPAE_0056g00350 [Botrytis paeoniae]